MNDAEDHRPRSSSAISAIILNVPGSCIFPRCWRQWSRINSMPFLNRWRSIPRRVVPSSDSIPRDRKVSTASINVSKCSMRVVRVRCGSSPSAMYDRTQNPLMALSCSRTPVVTRTFSRSRDCISISLRLATVGRSPIRIQHFRIGRLRQAARDSFARALVTWAMDGNGDGARATVFPFRLQLADLAVSCV